MRDARLAATLARIDATDARTRAFLAVDRDVARRPPSAGPLNGMAIALKDAYRTELLPTTFGTAAFVPGRDGGPDAVVVQRLRAHGATIVGKTNCGELCIGDYVLRGAPVNPRAPRRSVSGSSGGCAVAVAAGLVRASVGTDSGGSVRIPAAFCGVLGLKLTTGSVSLEGAVPLAPSLDCAGVIAASIAGARRVAEALLERDLGAAATAVRIGVTDPRSARDRVVRAALTTLAGRAHAVVVAPFDRQGWQELHLAVMRTEAVDAHGQLLSDDRLGAEARAFLSAPRIDLPGAADRRSAIAGSVDALLHGVDVLVTPAVDAPPPRQPPVRDSDAFWQQLEWLAPINHTGHPALVLPVASDSSRPVALQLIARHGEEATLLTAAAQIAAA
jgi:amidase